MCSKGVAGAREREDRGGPSRGGQGRVWGVHGAEACICITACCDVTWAAAAQDAALAAVAGYARTRSLEELEAELALLAPRDE
jgi:hypothetical protein